MLEYFFLYLLFLKLTKICRQDMANEFSEENVQLLLRKAMAVLAAHLGFISRLMLQNP